MGLKRNKQISLIWVAISLTALGRSQNIKNITNLDCLKDYHQKMFCFWDVVGSSSNCTEDFALTYSGFEGKKEKCSGLQNVQSGGSALPNKCICNISVDFFVYAEFYDIEVESHGQTVGNKKIHMASTPQNIKNITNLDCFNDFHQKMFCFWDVVGSSSNCSEDFALTYTDFKEKKEKCHEMQNEQSGGSVLPNKCICNMHLSFFIYADYFAIEVQSQGRLVGNKTVNIASTFKPQAPSDVRVEFQEEHNGVVQWKTNYENNFVRNKLSFHVQILFRNNREVAKENFLTQWEPRYVFSKRQLKRGEDYVVRVRTRPAENQEFGGTWSEWSSEVGWTNDYKLTILELKDIIIPITCIVVLCLVIVNTLCLTRYKKKWWNNIPDPAKSKLAQSTLLKNQLLPPGGKSTLKSPCGKYFSRIVKAHKSRCDQLIQQNSAIDYVNISGGYYFKKGFFEPEDEDIERCVKIYSKNEHENQDQEDKTEHSAEDHLLEADLSIAKMFFDILCESSGIKLDAFENTNTGTSFGCLGWMDSFDKKEIQRSNSGMSAYRESGYSSYDSDDSPLYFLSDVDRLNSSDFGQLSDNKRDCMPYTLQVSIKDNSYQKQGSEGPGLASALYNARNGLSTDTFTALCLGNISDNKTINHKLLAPKSILYYNTRHLFSHATEDIRTKPDQALEITLQCYESTSDPTSVCQVSGYQSFNQAVQENELDCQMSGYKSFDQAVFEGGPDSGCQTSGYQSFDQAVQHGDDTSVCHITGYQSFEEAVQQNETSGSSDSSVVESGYRPSTDLIFRNSEHSPIDMSENDRQHQLAEIHCQIDIESSQTEKLIKDTITDCNKTINSQKHELLFSGLTRNLLEDVGNTTKQKYYPSKALSDKSIKALQVAVNTYLENDLPITDERVPFALTFDICEHLRNLENMQGHKVSLHSLIVPCHQFIQEQFISNTYLTSQKYQPTKCADFENLSYFVPFCDLETLGSNQQDKHLLIQQSHVDKDGNSYMKLALP